MSDSDPSEYESENDEGDAPDALDHESESPTETHEGVREMVSLIAFAWLLVFSFLFSAC